MIAHSYKQLDGHQFANYEINIKKWKRNNTIALSTQVYFENQKLYILKSHKLLILKLWVPIRVGLLVWHV